MISNKNIFRLICALGLLFTFNNVYSQYAACNPRRIYDQLQSGFHSTIATLPDDSYLVWGYLSAANGTGNNLTPVALTPANGYTYTGIPLHATLGTNSTASAQFFLMSSTGLYVWGTEGTCINNALTTSTAFQSIPMPTGLVPSQVSNMIASYGVLALLTTTGEVWVNSNVTNLYGVGATAPTIATNFWAKVTTNAVGNPFLTGVTELDVTPRGMVAYSNTGTWYTWGTLAYLGNGTAAAALNRATPMTAPFVGEPRVISMTSSATEPSYFALNSANNKIYSMGNNSNGQLGINNTTNQTGWVIVKDPGGVVDLDSVTFISGNDQDNSGFAAVGCITSARQMFFWGSNNGPGMIGQAAAGNYPLPLTPNGFTYGVDNPQYIEIGGHTGAFLRECGDRYCYTGHKIKGSMGDGVLAGSFISTFDCANTPPAVICGASSFDAGDAPYSYDSTNAAAHYYKCPSAIRLGILEPTSNTGAIPSVPVGASNIGTNGDGLEEDGIDSLPTYLGGPYTINVKGFNTSGANAIIYAWVDWNDNGVFELSEFKTQTVTSSLSMQNFSFTWPTPGAVACGKKYARFRFTSAVLVDDTTTTYIDERSRKAALDGEVEDYFVGAYPISAGPDKSVSCFFTDSVNMSASGPGTWSIGAASAGTATIVSPTSTTTKVKGFTNPGTYYLMWVNGGCRDTAIITTTNFCSTPDTQNVRAKCPTCPITVCVKADNLSGPGVTTYSSCGAPANYSVSAVDSCRTFTGNGSNTTTSSTCIVACRSGVCDTTFINLLPPPIPDTKTVRPACPSCPITVCATADNLPAGPGAISYSACGTGANYNATPVDSCRTYSGNGNNTTTSSTCIIACKNGVCDSTYINILPPPIPDTQIVRSKCPSCPVTVCVKADNLPAGPGAITYSACGNATNYNATPIDSCRTFTGNGSNTSTSTTCIVACKNGVCDTSYITLLPPPIPDTKNVRAACPKCPITVCATADNLPAGPGAISYSACGAALNYSATPVDSCRTFTGNGSNTTTSSTCLVACKNGVCDTTYINLLPPPIPDTQIVRSKCPSCPVTVCVKADNLPAGPGAISYSTCSTPANYNSTPVDSCITYSGNGSNTTTSNTCIVACKNGVCDTTYITLLPPPIPDTKNVRPACPSCPITVCVTADNLPAGPGAISYSACGAASNYSATPVDSCRTFNGNGSNTTTSNTCIVACKNGVCDTTYINILPPPIPDTQIVRSKCPSCPVTVCVKADNLPAGPGAITYSACGNATNYNATPIDSCRTFTGNGSNTTTSTTCIVACKNGVCDTTYITLLPPPIPDTKNVRPACPSCPITVCVTADNLPAGPGAISYSACGAASNYSATPVDSCRTFNGNGSNTTTSNTCIVACKNGVCDTTYINILPPPIPDTQIVRSKCPSCPVTVCVKADNLPAGPGAITYSACGNATNYNATPIDSCRTFTGNGSNTTTSTTCIVACKNGVCDTTYITLLPPPIPDTKNVRPACPSCPITVCVTADNLPAGPGAISYSACGAASNYSATPVDSCRTFNGNGSNTTTSSTCLVACKNGVCDTTYINILPPPIPDTQIVRSKCPSCPVTVCVKADNLPAGPGAISYSTCTTPANYNSTPVDSCITYSGNGSNTTTSNTCIVACKNGVCDTTYITLLPPPIPDTKNVTPACPTCPITVCVTADNLPAGPGAISYSACGAASNYSATPVDSCRTFTGNGSNTSTVSSTCIVACKNGVCDTTYINLLPPTTIITKLDSGIVASTGGTPIANVFLNDSIYGAKAIIGVNSKLSRTGTYPTGISLDTINGSVNVLSGTVPGRYVMFYNLCDTFIPQNCKLDTIIVTVTPVINPITENGTVASTGGVAIVNVISNDSTNGVPSSFANSTISQSGSWPSGITLNTTNGSVNVATGTPVGAYPVTYQLCDKLVPVTCKTVVDTIFVISNINPITENGTAPSTGGVAIVNVISNDSTNGVPSTFANSTISQSGSWPTGITLNTTDGSVNVATGTPVGTYPVTYQLCDKLIPVSCKTVVDTIFVTPVINPITENGTAHSTGGVAIANVISNDSTNGVPSTFANSTISQSGSWPTGITLNTTNGSVNVATGTPVGAYPVTYQLCDKLVPVTCKTVVDTIFVTPVINPITENGTVASTGGVAIANVISNDSTNGVPSTFANSTISQSGSWPTGITLNTTNGSVNVATGTPVGAYPVTYQLCDKLVPVTCNTVVDTIFVTSNINPITENGTAPSTGGVAIANVISNDSTNGVPSTFANSTISQSGSWPTGITLNTTDGSVNVATGTPVGTYPVTYQLCDKLIPVSCKTVVDTIFVTPVINPITENGTAPSTGGVAIANVISNDSTNGVPSTFANSTISQSGSWPTGITLNTTIGSVNVATGTPVGTYPVTYQLCDKLVPVTCKTVVDTIFVTPVINPITENGTVASTGGVAIANVISNDSTNGVPSTFANSTISQSGSWPTGITLNTTNGSVNVATGTPVGAYPVTYQLCDKLVPVTCNTVVDTIFVTSNINPITENGTAPSTGGVAIANVISNDSTNGVPSTFANSTISQSGSWPTGITLNTTDGSVNVATGTPVGTYPVTYQLCDKLIPVSCKTVVDTIFVTPVINPITENGTAPSTGGVAIANVISNDSTNGVPSTFANSTISQSGSWPTGITLNTTNGSVNVATGTPVGTYPVTYQLCDKLVPVTCKTVVDTIFVTPVINPITENGTVASTGGVAIANVISNDSTNGVPSTFANSTISQSGSWPTGITLNTTNGSVNVATGTPVGAYPVTYQLCDKLVPVTCNTVVDTIFVTSNINPITENGTAPSTGGVAIVNVISNDSTNGVPSTFANSTISQSGSWPTGITLNTTDGSVNVATGTPVGTYPVTYQLCDKLIPVSCKTVTDTIFVTPVINPITENGTAPSTGGVAIANVISNDSTNGVPSTFANSTISQSGSWPSGITLNTTDGSVNVATGTPVGAYPVTYQLCDKLVPVTCKTVVDTIFVTPVINPITENGTVASTGGVAIANVISNDSTNGVPSTFANSTISQSGSWPTGITLNTTNGSVNVATGTPVGAYPVTYQLCDKLVPVTCNTVVDTIFVTSNINPITENGTAPSTGGVAIVNVISNDSTNGVPSTFANSTISQSGSWPTGITLDTTNGSVNVATGTPVGTYPVTYQLCDKLVPVTCKTVVDTIFVTPVINPITENGTAPSTGGVAIANVISNDSTNGVPSTFANSTISQSGSWPSGITLNTTDGSVNVATGTPVGAYPVTYQLCDKLVPVTCKTVVDTIFVTPVINPITENGTAPSTGGVAIANVISNDSTNGVPSTFANSTISQSGSWPSGITLNTTDGSVNVATGTPVGTYPVTYQLCDKLVPVTCKTVVDTIFVTPVINPITENGTAPSTGGVAIVNVISNDSTNGVPSTFANSTISQSGSWPTGITLDTTNGSVNVATGTPVGTYPVTYQLCDKLVPVTCKTVVDTIFVTPVINPITENGTAPSTGGVAIANVISNDSTNGVPSTFANSTISQSGSWPSGITLNTTDGSVNVATGTPVGTYPVTYQLCDKLVPVTCKTVVDTIFVTPVINPITENGTAPSTGGVAIANVISNDSTNGVPSTFANSTISQSGSWPTGITLDTTNGSVNVATGTPVGTYPVTYQLCDKLVPVTCKTVVDTIFVTPVINPITENGTAPSTGGVAIVNVISNDSTNGVPSTFANSTISQSGSWPTGITLDTTNGSVNVATGTPVGTYPVTYQLCDKLVPVTCKTVVDTIFVTPVINPITENGTAPSTGGVAIANVISNDSTNGVPSTFANSTISQSGSWPSGITLNTTDGSVNVATGTPVGTYPVTYQLCDKLVPVTCKTVVDTIFVTPVINPITENGTAPSTGGVAIANVISNDSTNGVPSTFANSTISQSGSWPTGITLDTTNGSVNVATGTPVGTYPVTYQLCDKLTPVNCKTVVDTIFVTPVINPMTENGTALTTGGIAIVNILSNDSTNGVPSNLGNSTVSQVGLWTKGITLDTSTGSIVVGKGTVPGKYTVTYQLCDKLIPVNCKTMVDSIFVLPVIVALGDIKGGVNGVTGQLNVMNVLVNDTVNTLQADLLTNVVVTPTVNGPLKVNADGSVDVAPNTPAGTYSVVYTICDKVNPSSCDTAIATVNIIAPTILANGDIKQTKDGLNGVKGILNVLNNDLLGSQQATLLNVVVTPVSNGPVKVNADGSVDLAPKTPAGVYTVIYMICDKINPSSCDTAIVTIVVNAPDILAEDDDMTSVLVLATSGKDSIVDVLWNDKLNNVITNLNDVVISIETNASHNGVTLDVLTGMVKVAPYTPAGTYRIKYMICDRLNPSNCSSAFVIVEVRNELVKRLPNGFSPDGDGINDLFVIEEIRQYPDADLVVHNRWGDEVWNSNGPYKHDWTGVSQSNSNLPDGTYYYVIQLNDGKGTKLNGFIELRR